MRKTSKVKLICLAAVIVVIAVAAVLLVFVLRREPPSASQESPAVSPGPVVPEPTPTPELIPTPEPTEPPYDVWSDPNVLWAIVDSTGSHSVFYNWFDELDYSDQMREIMEHAEEDTLIAFNIRAPHGPKLHTGQLDLCQVIIPEEWEPSRWLAEELESCVEGECTWEELDRKIADALEETLHYKEVQTMGLQLRNMMHLVTNELWREEYTPDSEGNEAYYAEVKRRLMADEEFVQLYQKYCSYCQCYIEFYRSLYLQELEPTRELFLEKGFIPIYSEENVRVEDMWAYVEDPERTYSWLYFSHYGGYEVRAFMKSRLWAFAGTKEQIGWIDAMLKGEATDLPMLESEE